MTQRLPGLPEPGDDDASALPVEPELEPTLPLPSPEDEAGAPGLPDPLKQPPKV